MTEHVLVVTQEFACATAAADTACLAAATIKVDWLAELLALRKDRAVGPWLLT